MEIKFYWHIHHETLIEPLTESLKTRIQYIKNNKPKDEVGLRLRLLKPVKGKLPKEVVKADQAWAKAYQAWVKADQARVKAYQAWVKAYQAWDKAVIKHKDEIEALHKKECGCGWNRKTIFTKENGLVKHI